MFGSCAVWRCVLDAVFPTGAANENGKVPEDTETIPEQSPPEDGDANPADEPAIAATSASSTAAAPPAEEESEPAAASPPADAEAPAADTTPEAATSSPEPAAATPEQGRLEWKRTLWKVSDCFVVFFFSLHTI